MSLITPAGLPFFFSDLQNRFWQAYGVAEKFYDKICTTRPIGTEQVVDGWLGKLDKPRLWTGARAVRTPAPQTYIVPVQNWELTESVDKFKIDDDMMGIYYPIVQDMGENFAKNPDYQVRDLLQGVGAQVGAKQNGLDGLPFFSTAHPIDFYDASKGSFCNDFTGGFSVGGINVGGPIGINAYQTIWNEFASRRAESGEALGVTMNCLMHSPQINFIVKSILQGTFFAPGSFGGLPSGGLTGEVGAMDNVLRGTSDSLMVRELSNQPTVYYGFDTTRSVRALIWNVREKTQFAYRISPTDPVVFDTHQYIYGGHSRETPSLSHAWLAMRSG